MAPSTGARLSFSTTRPLQVAGSGRSTSTVSSAPGASRISGTTTQGAVSERRSFTLTADDSKNVEEIIVKGNVLYVDQVNALKTPVPILEVPQTVSIVTDDDIRKQGFREIGDIIRYVPGVNTSQGEGHRDAVVFRGVRSTADFFQDGIRDDVQY